MDKLLNDNRVYQYRESAANRILAIFNDKFLADSFVFDAKKLGVLVKPAWQANGLLFAVEFPR